ncbi:MAG TPA: DUF5658 family protein [Candidatus Angelobacter sp.]|jgi:hypothetical protein|nr:DUF5658 family protein [Candidatus Angelobacter sp.]
MIDRAIAKSQPGVSNVLRDLLLRRVYVAAVIAQVLDAFSTAAGLRLGLDERNPFTVSVLHVYGIPGLLLQKVLVAGLLLAAMAKLPRRLAVTTVVLTTAVTAYAVCANLVSLIGAAH